MNHDQTNEELEFWGSKPERPTRQLPRVRRQHIGDITATAAPTQRAARPAGPAGPQRSSFAYGDQPGTASDGWDDWDETDPLGERHGAWEAYLGEPTELTVQQRRRAQSTDPLIRRATAGVVAMVLLIIGGITLAGNDSKGALSSPAAVATTEADPARGVSDTTDSSVVSDEAPADTSPEADEVVDGDTQSGADDTASNVTPQQRPFTQKAANTSTAAKTGSLAAKKAAAVTRTSASAVAKTATSKSTTSKSTTSKSASTKSSTSKSATSLAKVATCRNASKTKYKVRAGDYWIAIARRAQVTLKALLAVNGATAKTPVYPGMSVCLPKNAKLKSGSTPSTPSTEKPKPTTPTTVKPAPTSTTEKPKPTTPTTVKPTPTSTTEKPKPTTPTTTKPTPTTTKPPSSVPPKKTYTQEEVKQIIREVWPDNLEEKAIAIAWRESNWTPRVRNYCCYGLFQMYWDVHKKWLIPLGVVSAEMLYDPRINATAALALYERAGGWGPWAQTAG